ncbi:hypothetical protein TNCV_3546291 [Trichonephila clavipes]|nr:hypothetical protein TNCV_3546291 [Trichonephila clavipes]
MSVDQATRGLLATDSFILNHGQVKRTALELAPPSPKYHTKPTLELAPPSPNYDTIPTLELAPLSHKYHTIPTGGRLSSR